ncbi:MAG: endonuclease III domain-containing protein [Thermoplasmata archaeon]
MYWWPAEKPLEVMEGAILAQNTTWKNAEVAVKRLNNIPIDELLKIDEKEFRTLIREAGFFSRKIDYLRNAISFYSNEIDNTPSFISIRDELLKIRGIGRETADSIALYAFNQRTFPVDSYSIRFFNRYFSLNLGLKNYDDIRVTLSGIFNSMMLMEFHALIVEHSKNYCRKKPNCENCFLKEKCGNQ